MLKLIAVDLQRDFTNPEGKHFNSGRAGAVAMAYYVIVPFLSEHNIKIAEIVSDYRQPRPGDLDHSCVPGTFGYESEIPESIVSTRWIKCMNSPLYTRTNAGVANSEPGLPIARPEAFYDWLEEFCKPGDQVALFGLTLDCCVLCTAQAIRFHGIEVKIIKEATATYNGFLGTKISVMNSCLHNWASWITWDEAEKSLLSA